MVRRLRHMIIAFVAGSLFHKFLLFAYQTWTSREFAPGGEVLFIPLTILLVMLGWNMRELMEFESKKESS